MPTNDFKSIAAGGGAVVLSQAQWAAAAAFLANGYSSGVVPGDYFNKSWRQATVPSSQLAQLMSDVLQKDIPDDGNLVAFEENLFRTLLAAPVLQDVSGAANTLVFNPPVSVVDFISSKFFFYGVVANNNTSQTVQAVINGSASIPVKNIDGQSPETKDLLKGRIYGFLFDPTGGVGNTPVLKIQSGLTPIRLTANATVYVDAGLGNDASADGSAALPFQTLQAARNFVVQHYNAAGLYSVTFNCTGAFTAGLLATQPIPGLTSGNEFWNFQAGSTIITSGQSNICMLVSNCSIYLEGPGPFVETTGVGGIANCISVTSGGYLALVGNGLTFGPSSRHHLEVDFGGVFQISGNYTVSGTAANSHHSIDGGTIQGPVQGTQTITFSGTPGFGGGVGGGAVINVQNQGVWKVGAGTLNISGSATGQRYAVINQSLINTGGRGANYFPGSVAGTVDANFSLYL